MLKVKFQTNPSASAETRQELISQGLKRKVIVSFTPHDLPDCDCIPLVQDFLERSARPDFDRETNRVTCPRSKEFSYKPFRVICGKCGEIVARLYAKDETLRDFCDLHYISWTDGLKWYGCLATQISPIDLFLNFECACGNDTRDFRIPNSLSHRPALAAEKERQNSVGRGFGLKTSAFLVEEDRNG